MSQIFDDVGREGPAAKAEREAKEKTAAEEAAKAEAEAKTAAEAAKTEPPKVDDAPVSVPPRSRKLPG